MFNKDTRIHGIHSYMMDELRDRGFFKRQVDIYIQAPIVGFYYNRKAEVDKSSEYKDKNTNINSGQIIGAQDDLFFNFRLIMLLENEKELSLEERITRAFKDDANADVSNRHTENMHLFTSYVLGGIEVLYEKIIEIGATDYDYIKNSFAFLKEQQLSFASLSADDLINEL